MIVRTYGRRSRGLGGSHSDLSNGDDDDVLEDSFGDSLTLSQDTPQDFCNLPFSSSQDSSSFWSSQENNNQLNNSSIPTLPPSRTYFADSDSGCFRKSKKQKKEVFSGLIPPTSTLMEAQEFGEMMEHVDEVNFAIDGLKKGSQVRIRRASLLSLLSICGTAQQRRLLRTEGLAKTIIDAILGLSFDDSPCNLAAAALFYVLTSGCLDDHLLESYGSIHFLIKLLKPVISTTMEDKSRKIGSKLLSLCKDADIIRDTTKILDSSSSAIFTKVQEILVSCKELKSSHRDDDGIQGPELSPKWISLLTMEKACLSKISLEDTTGTVRKIGGNFKEKLRELGGLDAIFEVIMNCYSVMEGWVKHRAPSIQYAKRDLDLQSLAVLLKCLKIMENATFLSKDNQSHLLGMKGYSESDISQLSFMELIISIIKILSDLHQPRSSSSSIDKKSNNILDRNGAGHASELVLVADCKGDSPEVMLINSDSNSEKSSNLSENSLWSFADHLGHSDSNSETTTTINDSCLLKMRSPHSSLSSSCSGILRSYHGGKSLRGNGSRSNFCVAERSNNRKDEKCGLLEDMKDPFAFDEDSFEPSKWDLLSGKQKRSGVQRRGVMYRGLENEYQYEMLMSRQESGTGENCRKESNNGENHWQSSNGEYHFSHESSCSHADNKEISATLLADGLLTAVKVLMNLTNDNPIGCQQIAACGGLETTSCLIARHFPSFNSSLFPFSDGLESEPKDDIHLTDQELDFLVAILGLLVNLVEKDGNNRSRLAAGRVPLPNSEGLGEESHRDVIPLLCSIFLANQGTGDVAGNGNEGPLNDDAALLEGEKEAEKMIVEAYAALLLAFLSTESTSIRAAIAECLPKHNLAILVPVLERFVTFHVSLNMISPETHKAVSEVIESCRVP